MNEPVAPVVLRCEITIDGVQHAYQAAVPRRDWQAIEQDEQLRTSYEAMLRARLGAAVMDRLQPPVTVQLPTELDEAAMQHALAEQDSPD